MKAVQNVDEKVTVLHKKTKQLVLAKKEEDEIILELAKEGIERGYAELILENVKTDLSDKIEFRKELLKGIIITIIGILLNITSFIAFSGVGAIFWIVYWGIVVWGITLIFRAFIIFKK